MAQPLDRVTIEMSYEVSLDLLRHLEDTRILEGPLGGPLGLLKAKLGETIVQMNKKGSKRGVQCPRK